jgi:MFS-type transporter involved in bile tolerance (Atg22 family)
MGALLLIIIAAVVGSFPATWLLMLFLGNLGATQVGFWGALPAGILLTFFFAGAGASSRSYMS